LHVPGRSTRWPQRTRLFSHSPLSPANIMPVSPATLPLHQDPCPQPQVKLCSSCRSPLSQDQDPALFFPDSDASDHLMLCRPCKERYLLQTIQQQILDLSQYAAIPQDPPPLHPYPPHPTNNDAPHTEGPITEHAPMIDSSPSEQLSTHISPSDRPLPPKVAYETLVSSAPSKRAKLAISTPVAPDGLRSAVSPTHSVSPSVRSSDTPFQHSPTPDPSVDITRLRVRSQGHHCLYPGATFQGTQKSGRNSYDVTVSIVVR
jgi:glucose-induced degradation protein 4